MVSSIVIAGILFGCILAGTLIGMFIARSLPSHHLIAESKEAVKQGLALIATLTALVLGLLVATTKGTYDSQTSAINDVAANVALLDRLLARYGPETTEMRRLIAPGVKAFMDDLWHENGGGPGASAEMRSSWEALFDKLSALVPKTDAQRLLKSRSQDVMVSLSQTRQKLLAQKESSIPTPFLVVLGFWMMILFGCYGLLAPRNLTVIVVLVICMLSVSAAVFLVLEMDKPFEGIIRVPSAPLRALLTRLGD